MAKVFIIEDDNKLAHELRGLLLENDYDVQVIHDFTDVAEQVVKSDADLILLDINIPGINGEQILRKVRGTSQVPVIMLTSRNSEADEIISMSYGADDFITKPFVPRVLLLRIEAILNRTRNATKLDDVIKYKDIKILPTRNSVIFQDQETILSKNEFVILNFLIKNHGKIVSRAEIMDFLWDDDRFVDDNTLTVNINRLRKKLSGIGLEDLIQTRRSLGYILE